MFEKETKLLVWCMGNKGKLFAEKMSAPFVNNVKIIGYTDSKLSGEEMDYYGYPVYRVEEIKKLIFDYIVIACDASNAQEEIRTYIEQNFNMQFKVVDYRKMLKMVRTQRVICKYKNSDDREIREIVKWLKNHEISVRNQREVSEKNMYEVLYDESNGNFPYVNFMGKRMYFPRNHHFEEENGKKFLINIVELDQHVGSPHLYIHDSHKIEYGDVIIDAGVMEGNFALSYIDMISKAYLIESDKRWIEALKLTFKPYKDKIVLVPKMLSDVDTENSITLDTLLQDNKVDFIKMDIEGAETRALLGGINTLRCNDARLSICAYHRKRDEEYINFILKSLGYTVSHSEGYMFFLFDKNIDDTLDFRRGVIYGQKY